MRLGAYDFIDLGELVMERDGSGRPALARPQERFENPSGLRLHKHGDLEYCKFRVFGLPVGSGVYVFLSADAVVFYVGKASSIARRFMPGYRSISPRMCYQGGPETTCRINALIAREVASGRPVRVLVLETDDFDRTENDLIRGYDPEWNRTGRLYKAGQSLVGT